VAEPAAGFVFVSAGLLSPRIVSEAISDSPKSAQFSPAGYSLNGHVPTAAILSTDIETAFDLAAERYDSTNSLWAEMTASDLRERWLIPFLKLLGFEPVYQRSHLQPSPDDRRTFGITHLGGAPEGIPMVLNSSPLDRSHEVLQEFLNLSQHYKWGLASDGRELRILRDFHHSRLKAFVGFDLVGIFESRDFPAFRALYRLSHASRFVVDGPIEALFQESRREGVQVGRDLQPQIRTAIEALGTGLLTPELKQRCSDGAAARALYRELLLVVYRMLFMLFAEQRAMLPPEGIYPQTYSLIRLRGLAERHVPDSQHEDLWEGLKASFRILSQGSESAGVFPYNGRLFAEDETPIATAGRCANRYVLRAIQALTSIQVDGIRQYVDFAHLGVEELGAVYESLLPYALRVTETPLTIDGRAIPAGGVYLDPVSTERSDLGAHYTRPELVDFVLEVSLDKLIVERLDRAGGDTSARQRELLDIRVLDPACGSGAFLIGAIDRLAVALATVRLRDIKPSEAHVQVARRDVLQHCIYGVDKDIFAVELCKVALWIHCAVKDFPLTFLDHRIQHGDSLVGWPLLNVPTTIPSEAFEATSKDKDPSSRAFLRSARARNQDVLDGQASLGEALPRPEIEVDFPDLAAEDERVPADVARKAALYETYLHSAEYMRWRRAADLWTAAFFWLPVDGDAPTTADYWRALRNETVSDLADGAKRIGDNFPAFHWSVRFPEIRARGGFDCILGNPPWEQFESREAEWFAGRAPEIAALSGASRKAAIDKLQVQRPELHRSWVSYVGANERLAGYMRACGRFTTPSAKANTYMLFTELAADSVCTDGRAGLIVKTALAVDKGGYEVFSRLLHNGQVAELHDIVNGGPGQAGQVFSDVAEVERFSVIGLCRGGVESGFDASVMNWSIDEARTRPRQRFTLDTLRLLSPRTRTLTSFRTQDDLDVAMDIHRRLPTLDFEDGGDNPWGIAYHTLFNSTTDSGSFKRREELEMEGWVLGKDKIFRAKAPPVDVAGQLDLIASHQQLELGSDPRLGECWPVYEGQLANRYDHRAKTYEGYVGPNKYGRKPGIPASTDQQKADPNFEVEPRYWMRREVAVKRLDATVGDRALLGFRDIGAPWTNRRSAKGALLPRYPATHACPVLSIPRPRALEFVALFNSSVFDFLCRGHMPGAHVALTWMLSQIAAPSPGLDPRLSESAGRLSLTSLKVARLFDSNPHKWDPEERYVLDVEIDATVACAYGITRPQYEVVLDSFEVMAREQIRTHGTYKFKEDCLAAYDRVD
jgi:N-6 DNA Methylase